MKMTRTIASILYYITTTASIIYLVTGIYFAAVLALGTNESDILPIIVEDDKFIINLPFTNTPFLLGDYTSEYIATTICIIIVYAIFIWLLSGIFNAFRKDRLFTAKNVIRLSRFYIFNLIIPIAGVIFFLMTGNDVGNVITIALLHMLAGVFAYFMAAIFRQGLVLQEEQDLTL